MRGCELLVRKFFAQIHGNENLKYLESVRCLFF